MNWPATTGSTLGPNRSSARCAVAVSHGLTTWPCTWRDIRTELDMSMELLISMQLPSHSNIYIQIELAKCLNAYELSSILKQEKLIKKETGNVYFVYLWGNRNDIVWQYLDCFTLFWSCDLLFMYLTLFPLTGIISGLCLVMYFADMNRSGCPSLWDAANGCGYVYSAYSYAHLFSSLETQVMMDISKQQM